MGKTRKEEKDFIRTDLGKKLYDYNNENSGYSDDEISEFISGQSRSRASEIFGKEPQQQDYLGGVSPLGSYIDFDPSKYDGSGLYESQLWNAEDFREQNQGIFDSLGRSTANLIGKTAVNVVGGLAGTAYGAVDAIANKELSRLWDNDLTTALDKASESIGDYFKVYKSNDFNNRNLISRAVLNPVQFTDELIDTLSFTTGAVLTEMISGGVASATIGARALKYFKGLNKVSKATEAGSELAGSSTSILRGLGNAGTLSRQLATGAAYEASVEARHASMELRETLYNQWLEDNPGLSIEHMPDEVKDEIDDRLSNAGLFTFLTNVALVGGSNIVQFPKVFGAGYNTSKRASDLSNRIVRNAQGEFIDSALPTTRAGRIASNIATAARNPIMEGIVEEGGQGVISGTAKDYFARKYDLDSKATVEDFLSSFGKSLIDTYTTAEGWEEIGMGMIIGSLGAPGRGALSIFGKNSRLGGYGFNEDGTRRELWTGGIAGSFQERDSRTAEIANYIEELNNNTSLMTAMKANYDFLVQSDSLDKSMNIALQNNDVFNFNNFRDDKIHSYITSRLKAGLSSDIDTTIDQLERISPEDLYLELRGQEELDKASEEDIRDFKRSTIQEFKNKADATKEAYNIVDNAYNGDNEEIKDYFAHSIATAKYLDIREEAINQSLSDLSNGAINNLNIRGSSSLTINQEIERLKELSKDPELTDSEKSDINDLIQSYNNISDKQRQLTVDEYQALFNMQSNDPVTLSLNANKITELLNDSRKLRERRQSFIEDYNNLFSEEGIKRIQRQQRQFLKEQEEARLKEEEAIRQQEAEQAKLDEELRVQDRKAEIKAKKEAAQVKKNELASKDQAEQTEEDTDDIESLLNIKEAPRTDPSQLSKEISVEEQISDLEERYQNELDNLKSEYDQNKFLDPSTPEPIEERDAIHAKYQSMIDNLNNNITPEENAVLTNIEQEEAYNQSLVLKEDGLIRNPTEEDSDKYKIVDNTFKRSTANTLISLNINYAENILGNVQSQYDEYDIYSGYTDDGRLDIVDNFDSRLQDPNQFNKGTSVNIIIPTYQQILDKGIGGAGYTESEYNSYLDNVDMLPIAFTDNEGNILGFLPTQENVRKRVNPEFLNTELAKNKELRQQIFDNRDTNITATITNKSSGTPMFQKNQVSLYEALGDGNRLSDGVSIGIFKEGKLQVGINNPYQQNIKLPDNETHDQYFNEGYVYSIIPTAKQGEHFALGMNVSNISEDSSNSIIKILELYKANPRFSGDASLIAERDKLSVEADFNNLQEVYNALGSILYINNDNDAYMFRIDNDKLILGLTSDMQFTWNEFRKPSTKEKIKNILSKRYYAVRLADFNNPFNSYSVGDNGELNITRNKNYFDYLNNNRIVTSNVQSEPISNKANERYFTAQSVIEIGNVSTIPKQLESGQISSSEDTSITSGTTSPTTASESPKKTKNKLGLKLKSNRNKPRIDEDLSEIINTETSLDKQAELLMKKCSK